MGIFKGESSQIGLDIGTTAIRVVQLHFNGKMPRLVAYGSIEVDPKILQSDSPADRQQVIAITKQLLQDAKISTKKVVLGLPSAKVFVSLMNLPTMNEQELAKAISYQAEQYIPIPIDQVKYDWVVTETGEDKPEMEVLLVAAPENLSKYYYELAEAADLDVIAIEPDGFGLIRSLVGNTNDAVVILHFGNNSTDLVTVYKSTARLMRSIPIGGTMLVKTVAQNLSLDDQQARQFVYKFGLSQGKLDDKIYRAIQSNIDTLIEETKKSNKFFMSRYKEAKIQKIILSGESSQLPDLPNYLANETGLPIEIGNSWRGVSYDASIQDQLLQVSSQFSVAVGLAQREMKG